MSLFDWGSKGAVKVKVVYRHRGEVMDFTFKVDKGFIFGEKNDVYWQVNQMLSKMYNTDFSILSIELV